MRKPAGPQAGSQITSFGVGAVMSTCGKRVLRISVVAVSTPGGTSPAPSG